MRPLKLLTKISLLLLIPTLSFAQPAGKGFVATSEEDGSPVCFGWQMKFANGNVTDNGDGTCSIADQTGGAGVGGWTDNGTDINLTTSTDNVGIGGASLGKLSVDGDTDEIQALFQANATQTSNILVMENSAGVDILTGALGGIKTTGLAVSNLVSCNTIDTDANGVMTCGTDSGGGGNSFETITTPAGTSPVADSATDTLTITETTPFAITGTAGTDTIDFTVDAGADFDSAGLIKANAVALTTDTTGSYAAGDAEAGAALTGDTATAFFASGTIEHERGGLEADVSAYDGLIGITGGAAYNQTGTTTQIIIFDGSGAPTSVALSGQATMTNGGVVTVSDMTCTDCIGTTEIADSYMLNTGDTSTGAITITGSADANQLVVTGNATQTSDILVVEKNGGTDILTGAVGGVKITGSTTITQELNANTYVKVGSGGATDALIINSGAAGPSTITNGLQVGGALTDTGTSSIGWSLVSGANTACNTTCVNACVFGQDTATFAVTSCTDASSDVCVCAGGS